MDMTKVIENMVEHDRAEQVHRGLGSLATRSFANSDSHGFWDEQKTFDPGTGAGPNGMRLQQDLVRKVIPEKLMLIVSELAEALEEVREPGRDLGEVRTSPSGKPEGFPIELADAVIRIADLCGAMDINLGGAVNLKHAYNVSRPHKHGKVL